MDSLEVTRPATVLGSAKFPKLQRVYNSTENLELVNKR
jgi:hypothetical protein